MHTVGAVQVRDVKNIGRAALRIAVCSAAHHCLALLKRREAKGQSKERCNSNGGLHGDGDERLASGDLCV